MSLVLLVLTFVVAFSQDVPYKSAGDIAPGTVTINGADPAGDQELRLDTSRPLVIVGRAALGSVRKIRIEFSALGVPLGSGSADVRQDPEGGFTLGSMPPSRPASS